MISRRNIDVATTYKGVPVTGYVELYDTYTSACMAAKSVFALRDHFGGHTPTEEFTAACDAMHDAAMAIIAAEASVLNLTQHTATAEQAAAGVVEPENKAAIQAAITFDAIPSVVEIQQRAELVASIAASTGIKRAMIGGAPFFMSALESALKNAGIKPVYAFSVRDSIEQSDGNGGVKKVNIFRHAGWVEV